MLNHWHVASKAGVLHIDGEMNSFELQQRIKLLRKTVGKESKKFRLYLLSADRWSKEHDSQFTISNERWRESIFKFLEKNEQIKLLILDNLASLAPGIDENSKKDWDPISQWLLSLRRLGKAVIFVHHAGKSGSQRGTISREDIFGLRHKDFSPTGIQEF